MSKTKHLPNPVTTPPVALLHLFRHPLKIMFIFIFLTGCTASPVNLTPPATKHDFVRQEIPARPFVFTAWIKQKDPEKPTHIYIEGDGRAFLHNGHTISPNPTPVKQPTGFKLAMADPDPNVIYLARPCQYTPVEENPTCEDNKWWTSHRYDATTLSALNTALDSLVMQTGQPLHLIGYSGGATLALLAAATRHDVASIRTVAGNLSPQTTNAVHHVKPMPLALSPLNLTQKLATIPQIHFTGAKDSVVTQAVTAAYLKALPAAICTRHIQLQSASHHKGWVEKWPNLLQEEPACTEN